MSDDREAANQFAGEVEDAAAAVRAAVAKACAREREWPGRVAAAIEEILLVAAADPGPIRALALEATTVDVVALEIRNRLLASMACALEVGRLEYPRARYLPALTEQLLVGAVVGLIGQRLLGGEDKALAGLAPQLTELTLLPYLGGEQAKAWARKSFTEGR